MAGGAMGERRGVRTAWLRRGGDGRDADQDRQAQSSDWEDPGAPAHGDSLRGHTGREVTGEPGAVKLGMSLLL
jgi:hypothetical protein